MSTITFLSADIDEKEMKFDLEQNMKDVCKIYADKINQNIKHLVFFSNGKKLNKKMTVSEFIKTDPEKEIYVVLMDEYIYSESDEELAKKSKIQKEILNSIKDNNTIITYEKNQELTIQYGYDCKKRIEKEKKEHPENFIEVEDAINNKDNNNKLYILGQLGKSLENIGIEIAIDKRDIKNDDSIITNHIISSGMIQESKYEIHIEENDIDYINKKYAIINNENGEQEKFIDEFKVLLSQNIEIQKSDIIIANIREESLTFDVAFKNTNNLNIREKMDQFSKLNKIKNIYEKNILEACKLTPDMLDERGNKDPSEWKENSQMKGGLPYNPPTHNWVGYGLKVLDVYDDGNNDWIATNNNSNEWAVAYHGTSSSVVKPICETGGKFYSTSKEGAKGQKCMNCLNINPKSQNIYKICGEGTYVSPYIDYANYYANYYESPVIIMCRVNPNRIRIPQGIYEKKEWVTDGTRNTIRPYRILININKNKNNQLINYTNN